MFQQVIASLQSFGNFSDGDLSQVLLRLKEVHLRKNDFLIKEGQICQTFYYINQGCFRHYTVTDQGEEATLNLFIPTDWALEYKSFVTQQPSHNIIQAERSSQVFGLTIWDYHELVKLSDGFFRLGRILEQAIQNQDFQHNRITPEEKYRRLLSEKPAVLQNFPLKYIASYLGMSPETLSRIRKRISS